MKQFLVLCSMIALGVAIYQMIMGQGDDSVVNIVGEVWSAGIRLRTNSP